jgi:hypothetical protein
MASVLLGALCFGGVTLRAFVLRCIIKLSLNRLCSIIAAPHKRLGCLGVLLMLRSYAIALLVALVSAAPATAVIAIAESPHPAPQAAHRPVPVPIAESGPFGLAFGEIAAALAGICVIGLALINGRQPHSVTA